MGIRIIPIKLNSTEFKDWFNNEGLVCLENEQYYPATFAHELYDKFAENCTFKEWCEAHEIYTKWEINYQYGSSNWDWEIIKDENSEIQWLIIAVEEC